MEHILYVMFLSLLMYFFYFKGKMNINNMDLTKQTTHVAQANYIFCFFFPSWPTRSHWQQEIWCATVRNTGEVTLSSAGSLLPQTLSKTRRPARCCESCDGRRKNPEHSVLLSCGAVFIFSFPSYKVELRQCFDELSCFLKCLCVAWFITRSHTLF